MSMALKSISPEPPIYCGFSSATGFFGAIIGRMIRVFTGGEVNHAFFAYWSPEWQAWLTVGANANGVTMMTVPEFLKTRRIKYLFAPAGWSIWDGLRAHVADLDRHYNYAGLFGMAHVEIMRKLTGRPGANLLNDRDDLFCSEWCAMVVRAGLGPKRCPMFLPGYENDQVDPSGLCSAERNSPGWFSSVSPEQVLHLYADGAA